MKINVTENKVSIKEEQILNENEYNIHKIQFDFSSEYTDDLVKVALFSIDNHTYKKIISNNECDIPPEVLTQRGYSILGVYAYKTEQDTLVLRYSPSPTRISVYDGSYKAEAENSEPITPSEIEQYQQILQNSLQQFQNQYNALVEETEGDIQAIEDELQRKVDEGYFDGEDGFSPIANVIQLSNGAKIEIEDKTGRTSASVFNGYSPQRGVDYWTQEDKEEVIEEATQQIEGKIEEYNENAAEKLNQYNQNSVQKTNDYNTNAEQKMSAYNTNATEKFDDYNSNAEQKEINYNTNASQKVESFNTNANSKLSEYNSNAETKKTAYDENATQKTNSFNTNATNKLTEYNTNHTEKMSAYNSNSIQKLNAFNENATQKTEDFDEHTEEIQESIENLQTENARLKATLPTTTGEGQAITLNKTAELEFVKPPLPMGNSEQVQYSGKNKFKNLANTITRNSLTMINDGKTISIKGTNSSNEFYPSFIFYADGSIVTAEWWPTVTRIDTTKGYFTESEKTYMFSLLKNGTYNGERVHYFIGKETNIVQNNIGAATTYTNLIASNSEKINFVAIGFFPNQQVDLTFEIQIEEGSTSTITQEYEPYVGGTASPNPDYPQEITNVTGDVEVVVQNKNLCNGINQGYYLTMNTSICGKSTGDNGLVIKVDGTSNYTVSTKATQTRFRVACLNSLPLLDGNVTAYNGANRDGTSNSITINTNGYKYLIVNVTDLSSIQIEKGTTATSSVLHKEQVLPLTLGNIELCKIGDYQDYFDKSDGRNLFDKDNITRGSSYNYGTTGSVPTYNNSNMRATISPTNSIKVLPSTTYTLSFPLNGFKYALGQMDSDYISLRDSGWKTDTTYTFTTEATTNYIGFNFSKADNSVISDSDWEKLKNGAIQLEKGSSSTNPQPYGVGEWYLHKKIGKVVLNGSENWQQSGAFTNDTIYSTYSGAIPNYSYGQGISNLFVWNFNISNLTITEYIATGGDTLRIGVLKSRLSAYTINEFKTWLSNNNVTAYYKLATPTYTEITDTTLISQLEAISKAISYEEQTNISSNQNAIFNVEAYQSTKLVLEERDAKYESLEARVALLE